MALCVGNDNYKRRQRALVEWWMRIARRIATRKGLEMEPSKRRDRFMFHTTQWNNNHLHNTWAPSSPWILCEGGGWVAGKIPFQMSFTINSPFAVPMTPLGGFNNNNDTVVICVQGLAYIPIYNTRSKSTGQWLSSNFLLISLSFSLCRWYPWTVLWPVAFVWVRRLPAILELPVLGRLRRSRQTVAGDDLSAARLQNKVSGELFPAPGQPRVRQHQ